MVQALRRGYWGAGLVNTCDTQDDVRLIVEEDSKARVNL